MHNYQRVACVLFVAGLAWGCGQQRLTKGVALTGGDPYAGERAITHYGCGSCHKIPGVSGAVGLVGPPLAGVGDRAYVAGELTNRPANMIRWIQHPHSVNERTAMPELGVTPQDAKDIAAFLYSLE